ncbi:MAG: hypothetical protein R3E12_03000 [Candidatus Eisenbacteria bacterium]
MMINRRDFIGQAMQYSAAGLIVPTMLRQTLGGVARAAETGLDPLSGPSAPLSDPIPRWAARFWS